MPDAAYHDDYDGHPYVATDTYGDLWLSLLRGECEAEIEVGGETRTCSHSAAFRMVDGDETDHRCRKHLPKKWENALEFPNRYEFSVTPLEQPCTAPVSADPDAGDRLQQADDEEGVEAQRCGDRAFLRANSPTGESYHLCRTHARVSWILSLRADSPAGSEYDTTDASEV